MHNTCLTYRTIYNTRHSLNIHVEIADEIEENMLYLSRGVIFLRRSHREPDCPCVNMLEGAL